MHSLNSPEDPNIYNKNGHENYMHLAAPYLATSDAVNLDHATVVQGLAAAVRTPILPDGLVG